MINTVWFVLLALVMSASQAEQKYVQIEMVADQTAVSGGDRITVGMVQNIAPKWHVYWLNPGDSGEATEVYWSGLEGLNTTPIQWPIPHKIPFGPLTNYGYENQVVLLQEMTLPDNIPDGPFELLADISLLVCEEICLPEFHQATLVLNSDQTPQPETISQAQLKLPVPQSWSTNYTLDGSDVVLTVDVAASLLPLDQMSAVELFFTERGMVNNSAKAETSLTPNQWKIRQSTGDIAVNEITNSAVVITYKDPSGQRNGIELQATYQAFNALDNNTSFLYVLLLAVLGGLVLNVMPCVFPVLALKAMNLVHMQDESARQAKLHGWAYTIGILVSFLIIALVLIGLKTFGAQIGWGFQLQSPLFVMFLIYLLTLVALNLAGFFEFGTGLTNVGSKLANQQGLSGSFYTGVLATLVATPCTAPFMGVAIGYALVQPVYVSISVFLALGFGLAMPYLLLASFPVTRSWLPQPGAWMMKFKEFLAFPMLATVAWLVWVLSFQADSYGVLVVLMGLVTLALGIWLLRLSGRVRWSGWVFLLLALWPFYAVYQAQSNAAEAPNWQAFNNDRYAAVMEKDEAVFVNMTAAWCITCQVNEQVALNTETTKKLFMDEKIQYLKGDWTDFDAEITQYLEKYQRNGVPIYVFYGAKDTTTGQRPEPQVLPQILTPAIIESYVANKSE
ncbi:protein-disulfide reductase DsbD family protein [Marinicella sp. S1101]|uniref:protein-disulfide reductase DsbD family protein n=1 Tax=Marinicella marina TaxID=2996016 RepID=UPI0022608C30|nr:thioredoxin family protein [Marinicella marina]MCX7553635.1 protein-disulfide reductase DsbD family protein [Marinicella marina]MDJ1140259.1 protein-disulfide reductase DsbD family protein [Marinicella marina]